MDETSDPNAPRRPPDGAAPPALLAASPPDPTFSQRGDQANAQPAYGQPAYGQPAYGQPAYGQPAYGQPAPPPYPTQPFYPSQAPPPYPPPPAYGQQAPVGYWQQPGYGYPPQPMYGQPQPYGYYGAPPAAVFREPDHSTSTFAGVMWILLLLRNLLMIPLLFVAGAFLALLNIGLGVALWVLLIFPVIGMIGCVIAMASDFQRKNHAMGTVGAVLALVGSSFPGAFFGLGVVGMALGVIGLALHLAARKEWK